MSFFHKQSITVNHEMYFFNYDDNKNATNKNADQTDKENTDQTDQENMDAGAKDVNDKNTDQNNNNNNNNDGSITMNSNDVTVTVCSVPQIDSKITSDTDQINKSDEITNTDVDDPNNSSFENRMMSEDNHETNSTANIHLQLVADEKNTRVNKRSPAISRKRKTLNTEM